MRTLCTLLFVLGLLISQPLEAQSQSKASNYIEPGYQLTPILGSAGNFIELEAGRQLTGGLSFGGVVHFLISDISQTTGNQIEGMSSLWYVGPRLQYSSELNEKISMYGGSTFGFGSTDYQETAFDQSTSGGLLIGIRPEVGIRYKLSELLRINLGANVFYGNIISRSSITGAPAIRVGLRLGR